MNSDDDKPTLQEGARLIRAFTTIRRPDVRDGVIRFVETLAEAAESNRRPDLIERDGRALELCWEHRDGGRVRAIARGRSGPCLRAPLDGNGGDVNLRWCLRPGVLWSALGLCDWNAF
jgi:hypothetical protein